MKVAHRYCCIMRILTRNKYATLHFLDVFCVCAHVCVCVYVCLKWCTIRVKSVLPNLMLYDDHCFPPKSLDYNSVLNKFWIILSPQTTDFLIQSDEIESILSCDRNSGMVFFRRRMNTIDLWKNDYYQIMSVHISAIMHTHIFFEYFLSHSHRLLSIKRDFILLSSSDSEQFNTFFLFILK